jgi:hypothetical protein
VGEDAEVVTVGLGLTVKVTVAFERQPKAFDPATVYPVVVSGETINGFVYTGPGNHE